MINAPISRRLFLKRTVQLALAAGLSGGGGWGYATEVEPEWIERRTVQLTLPRLAAAFHDYRVVQVSDIHMSSWMTRARLQDVVRQANALAPDLLVLTGDFVSDHPRRCGHDLLAGLRDLRARDGILSVLGNHDHWTDPAAVRAILRESGVQNLDNAVQTMERGGATLHIGGVDDVWERAACLDTVLAGLPATGAAILLAHEPDFADSSAATGRFDLQLSGHSHGGQVIVPGYGPLRLPYLGQKYPLGQYQVGPMIQYTNRGVGMVQPRVRFNCRPEITLFTLQSPLA